MELSVEKLNRISASTAERVLAGVGLAIFAVGCFVVWFFNPSKTQLFPACPTLSVTGYACPGCGLTRGFHALFHGDIVGALDFNLLIPFFAIAFAYFAVSMLLVVVRGRALPYKFIGPTAGWAMLLIAVGFGIIRNIPVYPFTVLFP